MNRPRPIRSAESCQHGGRECDLISDELPRREADRIFRALGDGTRRDILSCALREAQSVSELARRYDMSFAAVQKHVAVLEHAGLIVKRARGRERVVNADLAMIQRASQLLRAYEHLDHERATVDPPFTAIDNERRTNP